MLIKKDIDKIKTKNHKLLSDFLREYTSYCHQIKSNSKRVNKMGSFVEQLINKYSNKLL